MRKLIVSINISLDGCIAGQNDELDWHFRNWSSEMSDLFCDHLKSVDTIVFGRVTYLKMAEYWPVVVNDVQLPREDYPLADLMNRYTKIVFSNTIISSVWHNTRVISEDPGKELTKMKMREGRDMMVFGSSQLVQSLIKTRLIDALILWIHPVVLQKGKLLFTTFSGDYLLHLNKTYHLDSGVTVLYYEVEKSFTENEG
jgi:dihydrofolate reductase